LGRVALLQRRYAAQNPNAIMREPLSLEKYLAAPYIVEPLRLFDYCLINDGGVALILTDRSMAQKAKGIPVVLEGIGASELLYQSTSLEPRLIDFYHTAHSAAADQVYAMANCGPSDIDCLQIYDSFSCHVLFALEGFGFCATGKATEFLSEEAAGLPINTSGGHLSESYMQGWNHQVEAVRQLRGSAGDRQVDGCHKVQYVCDAVGKVMTLVYGSSGPRRGSEAR